ncbi:MAG: hypothetical protein IM571_02225 [Chitinophagaceae bacterium]|jgi:hypothetical protein|nr:hypothetical protein [Chitinophagaceae bacterium]MCA6469120.1 hypothetical protein [Chitinophagaceae bacterium]MCA6476746.1 hypothetical protein [Chitinophagaceae bacterium]MCA6480235.1 hypothetical protein [Chitinophagaceae bacterium]MCA6491757.1 hypothetical protein [Chitinophagaceae bacterium]
MKTNNSFSLSEIKMASLSVEEEKEINGGAIPPAIVTSGAVAGKVLLVGAAVCGIPLVGAAVGYGCYKMVQWATK